MTDTAVLDIAKLDAPLGAEVLGLDLRVALPNSVTEALLQAWYDNQVLVIRDQNLTPEQMVAFTSQLGEPGRPRAGPRPRRGSAGPRRRARAPRRRSR